MRKFKDFLIEETLLQILILEGKAQHQLIRQFGTKILDLMQKEHGRLGESGDLPGTAHYAKFSSEVGHGTTNHMHDYIMKHMNIPETPSYLNIEKPEDANTWNKHLNWILSRYAQGDQSNNSGIQRLEDIQYRALPTLARFHELVKKGKMDDVSLAKWKNLTDMESAVQNSDPFNSSNLHPSEYTLHDENEHWSLVTPHTSRAACALGHGSHWCTTSGAFEHYTSEGPLYIMIPKKPREKNEKYQLHIESGQFMDKMDSPFDVDDVFTKNRKMTPKMEALVKLHRTDKNSKNNFTQEELDFLMNNHLRQMIKHPDEEIQKAAMNNKNFGNNPNDITELLKSKHKSIGLAVINHPKFGFFSETITQALHSPHESVALAAVDHPNFGLQYYNIFDALSSKHESVALAAFNHPKFGSELAHIPKALESQHRSLQVAAINHPQFKINPSSVYSALMSEYRDIQQAGMDHRHFGNKDEHFDKALRSEYKEIQQAAIEHPKFSNSHKNFISAINSSNESIARQAINHPHLPLDLLITRDPHIFTDSEHPFIREIAIKGINSSNFPPQGIIAALSSNKHEDVALAAASNPHFGYKDNSHSEINTSQIHTALHSPYESVALFGVNHPGFVSSPESSRYAIRSPHRSIQLAAINHPDFGYTSPSHKISYSADIIEALRSKHEDVALAAVNHPAFSHVRESIFHRPDETIMREALYSPHKSVQLAAASHPNIGLYKNFIGYALSHPNESVALAAFNHPDFGSYPPNHIIQALETPHKSVQLAAINHPNFSTIPENISHAIKSEYKSVAMAAANHPNFGSISQHIFYGIQSPYEEVQLAAVNHPKFALDNGNILDAIQSRYESVKKIAMETFAANERKNSE